MKLFRRGESNGADTPADSSATATATEAGAAPEKPAPTASKGRPTRTRREAQGKRRGPVAPPPMTSKEARARRKAARNTMSKSERKAAAAERRAAAQDRRTRMLAGEDKYLLPRDQGEVRAFVRDTVDARRNLVGLFMPMALLLILSMFAAPAWQSIITLAMLVMMVFMIAEGFLLGRIVNRRARERFPKTDDGGFGLGWYAFVRASQMRKMRAPKPRVRPGDAI